MTLLPVTAHLQARPAALLGRAATTVNRQNLMSAFPEIAMLCAVPNAGMTAQADPQAMSWIPQGYHDT